MFSCQEDNIDQITTNKVIEIDQRTLAIETQFRTSLSDLKTIFEDSNSNSNGNLGNLIESNSGLSFSERYDLIYFSGYIDYNLVEENILELGELSGEILDIFGEAYLDQIIDEEGGPIIFDAKFWGKECIDIPHVDAEGNDVNETCCTRFVFWVSVGTRCTF